MPAIEDLLAGVLSNESSEEKIASQEPTPSYEEGGQLDVGAFVESMGKTASLLEKAAESLPSSPALNAEQLKMLSNPLGIEKDKLHDQHKGFVGQVLPSAKSSLSVPKSLESIQKQASAEEPSFLRSWIGS